MVTTYLRKVEPELSANQIAKFLTTPSHTAKEGILRSAQFVSRDNNAHRSRYSDAREAIAKYVVDRNPKHLSDARYKYNTRLSNQQSGSEYPSDWVVSDSKLSLKALEIFEKSLSNLPISGSNFSLGDKAAEKISIENVLISVRPNVIITKPEKTLKMMVGGGLLYFSADSAEYQEGIDEEKKTSIEKICTCAATLVYMYAEQHLINYGTADRKICYSFDVFGGTAYQAPLSYVQRVNNIKSACRTIAAQWPTISPPPNWPKGAM
jgi:hypothetical protein